MIEKILERLEAIKGNACNRENCERCLYDGECIEGEQSEKVAIDMAIKAVQEVAKEYCVPDCIGCEHYYKEAGKICTSCKRFYPDKHTSLDAPYQKGE